MPDRLQPPAKSEEQVVELDRATAVAQLHSTNRDASLPRNPTSADKQAGRCYPSATRSQKVTNKLSKQLQNPSSAQFTLKFDVLIGHCIE
ncbi:MAG: hypothetical protein IKG18_07800 [Atopobiaceae bacterium]|nr:hypothetical protein [Atopobiaceae bacterium]